MRSLLWCPDKKEEGQGAWGMGMGTEGLGEEEGRVSR